ncbi:phosphatase PAP2 family protein [Sphingomonas oleivorans]|uniref:Phosphatase PAP2 family protein n=2 Tax=Sphingomonas oleivorans TaxID=1735121 RepID=A0A2T5FUS6_9SPHN|nr:phosphatase PAP2 family protein [Sphingomonas oleivorans]
MEAITTAGDRDVRIALTLIALGLFAWFRQWRRAALLLGMAASGAALVSGLKALAGRARPDLLPHLDWETSASLPSGHAANGMILYLGLALLVRERMGQGPLIAVLLLVLLIGMSRVALAVHWPSDVLAGWCLGAGWALLWTLPLQQNAGPEA